MKKYRLIILLALFTQISLISYGQLIEQNAGNLPPKPKVLDIGFGIKAGLNISTINNSQESIDFSPEMLPGFHAGVFANFHFGYRNEGSAVGTGWFGLQPEILYSSQGFAVDGQSVNFDYISLPILAKLYLSKQFNIEAGPYFSYLISVNPSTATIDNAEIVLSDLEKSKDAGIAVGMGYETKFGLTMNARFNLGLSDVASNLAWKNQVIAVSFGYMF
jgi:hypothetical protein